MDKKIKKRMQQLKDRLQNRRQQLAAAKRQPDEPDEVEKLQNEVVAIEAELKQLKEA